MIARISTPDDFDGWLRLAGEVEPLFGPMVDDPAFRAGLKQALADGHALCVKTDDDGQIQGGIVLSPEANEILWLAVATAWRGKGIGRVLLDAATECLDKTRPVVVTTFDRSVAAGLAARKLYQGFGFHDLGPPAGPNPAGIPTVIMAAVEPQRRCHAAPGNKTAAGE